MRFMIFIKVSRLHGVQKFMFSNWLRIWLPLFIISVVILAVFTQILRPTVRQQVLNLMINSIKPKTHHYPVKITLHHFPPSMKQENILHNTPPHTSGTNQRKTRGKHQHIKLKKTVKNHASCFFIDERNYLYND